MQHSVKSVKMSPWFHFCAKKRRKLLPSCLTVEASVADFADFLKFALELLVVFCWDFFTCLLNAIIWCFCALHVAFKQFKASWNCQSLKARLARTTLIKVTVLCHISIEAHFSDILKKFDWMRIVRDVYPPRQVPVLESGTKFALS